jgi:hypothetical protein
MENRDRDMNKGSKPMQDKSKKETSVDFGQNIGRSEDKLSEPSSRQSGSVGSSGMESGSKSDLGSSGISSDRKSSSDLGKSSSDLGSSSDSSWGDSGKGSQGGSRH